MTKRTVSIGLGALAALAALAVGQGDGAHAAPPPRPAAVANCQTPQLALAPDYGTGAAGRASLIFLVHNRAGQACTLYGYPGVQLLDGAYRGLPTSLRWGDAATPPRRLVYLATGADAYVALTWTRIPTQGQTCPTAAFVRITPPNASASTIVWTGQGGLAACGGVLTASPVEPAQFSFGVVPTP